MNADTLDQLLEHWAETYRLTPAQSASVRESVLRQAEPEIDPDWLWTLLRPVTKLVDGPRPLHETLMRGYA
jgi:hypothetical protein